VKKPKLSLLSATLLGAATVSDQGGSAWPDITVEVKADQPVTTSQTLTEQADGFQRLAITLSNQGKEPLTIKKTTVRIPLAEKLTDDLEVIDGSSCLGRTASSTGAIPRRNMM
jgi:alpha-galactosidase